MIDCEICHNSEAIRACTEVTEKLGLEGNISFDLRERENGEPIIMECNPRISAGVSAFELAGVNLLYINVKSALGENIQTNPLDIGTIVKKRWVEMV